MTTATDSRPWRKRHPVLSRVLLFGIAAAVIVGLWVAKHRRELDDRNTRLRGELESFDVVIWTPGGAELVRSILAEKFTADDLPIDIQVAKLRWEGMALRRLAREGDADAAALIEPTFKQAIAAAPDEATRLGLTFELAEARLEADDPDSALELLADADIPADGPWALMREHFSALATAMTGEPSDAARRIDAMLDALEAPLQAEPSVKAGGRTWNESEIATVSTERLGVLYRELDQPEAPIWRRLSELVVDDGPSQLICARQLVRVGDRASAKKAFARAMRASPEEAARWADKDPELSALRD